MVGDAQRAQFTDLLHRNDAFPPPAFRQQRPHKRGFAAARAAGDQYRRSGGHQRAQHGQPGARHQAAHGQRRQFGDTAFGESDGDRRALRHQRRDDRMHPDATDRRRVGDRAGVIQTPAQLRAQLHGVVTHRLRRPEGDARMELGHAVTRVDPHTAVTGHRHVGDRGVTGQILQRPQHQPISHRPAPPTSSPRRDRPAPRWRDGYGASTFGCPAPQACPRADAGHTAG